MFLTPLDTSAFATEDLKARSVKVSDMKEYIIKHLGSACPKSAGLIGQFRYIKILTWSRG